MPLEKLIFPDPPKEAEPYRVRLKRTAPELPLPAPAKKRDRLKDMGAWEGESLIFPDPPKAEQAPVKTPAEMLAAPEPVPEVIVTRVNRLASMAMAEPAPLPEPASEPEAVLAPMPEVVVTRVNRLASMAIAEPAPLPEPPVRADKLARMRDVEMPVIEPVVEATPAKQKKWSFEFERNPNGTIRRINATEVED